MSYFIFPSVWRLQPGYRLAAICLALACGPLAPAQAALITQDSAVVDSAAPKTMEMKLTPSAEVSLGGFGSLDPDATAATEFRIFKWADFGTDWADFTQDLNEAFDRQTLGKSDDPLSIPGEIKIERTPDQVDFASAAGIFGVYAAVNELEKKVAHAIIADGFYQNNIKPLKNNHLLIESVAHRSASRQQSNWLDKLIYKLANGLTYTDMFLLLLTFLSLSTISKILGKRT